MPVEAPAMQEANRSRVANPPGVPIGGFVDRYRSAPRIAVDIRLTSATARPDRASADARPVVADKIVVSEPLAPTDFSGPAALLSELYKEVNRRMPFDGGDRKAAADAAAREVFTSGSSPTLAELRRLIASTSDVPEDTTSPGHRLALAYRHTKLRGAHAQERSTRSFIDPSVPPEGELDHYLVSVYEDAGRHGTKEVFDLGDGHNLRALQRLISHAVAISDWQTDPEVALTDAGRAIAKEDAQPWVNPMLRARRNAAAERAAIAVEPDVEVVDAETEARRLGMAKIRADLREQQASDARQKAHDNTRHIAQAREQDPSEAAIEDAAVAAILPGLFDEAAMAMLDDELDQMVADGDNASPLTVRNISDRKLPDRLSNKRPLRVVADDPENETQAPMVYYQGSRNADQVEHDLPRVINSADSDNGVIIAVVPPSVARRYYNTDSGTMGSGSGVELIRSTPVGASAEVVVLRRYAEQRSRRPRRRRVLVPQSPANETDNRSALGPGDSLITSAFANEYTAFDASRPPSEGVLAAAS